MPSSSTPLLLTLLLTAACCPQSGQAQSYPGRVDGGPGPGAPAAAMPRTEDQEPSTYKLGYLRERAMERDPMPPPPPPPPEEPETPPPPSRQRPGGYPGRQEDEGYSGNNLDHRRRYDFASYASANEDGYRPEWHYSPRAAAAVRPRVDRVDYYEENEPDYY